MQRLYFFLQDQLRTALTIHETTVKKGWSPAKLVSEIQRDEPSKELKPKALQRSLEKSIERALVWGPQDLGELILIAEALEVAPQKLFVPQPDATRLLREVIRTASRKQRKDAKIFNDLAEILGLADEIRKL